MNYITPWRTGLLILKVFSLLFLIILITYLIIVRLTEFTLTPLDIYSGKLEVRKITFMECYLLPTWKRELFCFNISVAKVKIKKILNPHFMHSRTPQYTPS